MVVGVDVHVLCICTNRMGRTYNFHPALINVTVLQHCHNKGVCVCAWIIYTCTDIYIYWTGSILHDGVWDVHVLNKPVS